jgi:small GTP-binding protein
LIILVKRFNTTQEDNLAVNARSIGEIRMNHEEVTAKVCLVGDSGVGKTSLIRRFVFDEFDDRYLATLGAKITKREILVPLPDHDTQVKMKLLIFDIIGEKGFRKLLKEAFFYGANGLVAVCDVTNGDTLESLEDWIENAYSVTGTIPVRVLANKVDLNGKGVLTNGEVGRFCRPYHSPHDFSSAKTGENVEKAFNRIAKNLADRVMTRRLDELDYN